MTDLELFASFLGQLVYAIDEESMWGFGYGDGYGDGRKAFSYGLPVSYGFGRGKGFGGGNTKNPPGINGDGWGDGLERYYYRGDGNGDGRRFFALKCNTRGQYGVWTW